jgi:hypothetical protein
MNSFQAMHFVDKASPQQLKAMVDTQSPYSFMALAKLQQIRDSAMRQKAYEPTPPPLSQQIPQELAKGEAPAASQMPMGIAAMGGAPQMPMMPQQPQAGVGPEMSPAAAGGGLVAFKDGGGIKGFANPPYLVEDNSDYRPDYAKLMRQMRGQRINPESGDSSPALYGSLSRLPVLNQSGDLSRSGFPVSPLLGEDQSNIPTSVDSNLVAEPTALDVASATGIRNPNLPTGPAGAGGGGDTSVGSGMYSRIMGMLPTKKDLDAVTTAQNAHIAELDRIQRGLAFDRKSYEAAQGDVAGDRARLLKSYQELFPDPNKDMKAALDGLKAENTKDIENAPYQGMLKMAVALMSTDRTNLFQAVGKAGGVGLEEMNRATEAAKQQKMKLLEADARVASAQDARRRGDYDMANREAMQAKNDRMEVFRLEADSKSAQANAAAQLAAAKAGLPMEKVKLQGQMVGTLAAIHQAFKDPAAPEAVRTWQFAQKNPAFFDYMQTQRDVENANKNYALLEKNYDDDLKAGAITDPKMTKSQYVNEGMKRYLDFQQKQRTPRGTMPAN